ncbi:HNH endonuclease [Cutibacterium acnes]
MPVKPKRLCSHPGCPDFTSDGFRTAYVKAEDVCYRRFQCDSAINKRYDHRWGGGGGGGGPPPPTAHPLCEHCVAVGRVTPVQDVGHAIPLERDGGHDKANLRPCHSAKTAREDVWWRKAPRVYFY